MGMLCDKCFKPECQYCFYGDGGIDNNDKCCICGDKLDDTNTNYDKCHKEGRTRIKDYDVSCIGKIADEYKK